MLGWANSEPWFWAWVIDGLVSLPGQIFLLIITLMSSPAVAWLADPVLSAAKNGTSSPALRLLVLGCQLNAYFQNLIISHDGIN